MAKYVSKRYDLRMLRRWARRALPVLASLSLALPLIGWGCADRLLLLPSTRAIDPAGAERQTIPFDGGVLECWVARSPGASREAGAEPRAYLVEFCGNATRAETIASFVAKRWGERSIEVWAMNYPGFGGSTGPTRLKSIAPAALAAYDAVRARAGDRPILAGAHSFGTSAALYVAAQRPVTGLFLHNPPALRQTILGAYGWWNLWLVAGPVALQVPGELDSIANARQVHAPAVIVTAGKDRNVPPRYHRMVIDALAGPKRVIELRNANHHEPPESSPDALGEALDWLWSQAVR
jgi:pimeloyl-ACP methyl ester carboxylesterase